MDKKLEEKIKRAKKEGVDIKLTGSEFRQYVHISTRKMKYLIYGRKQRAVLISI